jgi:hypothetical protein
MSACAMQTFNNVTQAAWLSAKQAVAAKFGVQITTDSGSVTQTATLSIGTTTQGRKCYPSKCTDSPLLVPCSLINSEINNMVEATLNQHNIAIARMVPP